MLKQAIHLIPISLMLAGLFLIDSCQLKEKTDHPKALKVILDTDMGSDCDDAGAMALLHKYADLGKAEILSCIYSSGKVPYGAGVIEAINIYYGRPEIPVGAYWGDEVGDPVDKMGTEKLSKNTALFKNRIIHNRDAEEQTNLNRRLLAQLEDNCVDYITIGHTRGLYDLLVSEPDDTSPLTGYELVRKKIRRWVALGALGANNKEGNHTKDWNFFFNGTAKYTKYLVENFPKPIYFINSGTDIFTGKSLKATPENNIVRIAYENWLWNYEKKDLEDQRPSWDIVTVYFAVEGLENFLLEEESGWLSFDVEKGCSWEVGERNLQHHYIFQKEGINGQFADYLNEMISADPLLGDNSQ